MLVSTGRHTAAEPVDNLWKTCGKLTYPLWRFSHFKELSTIHPHVIHNLSTGKPELSTSHAM